jgi:hypothetical protein
VRFVENHIGSGMLYGMGSAIMSKKPKAGSRIPFQKGSSNPQTRYEERVRELEDAIVQNKGNLPKVVALGSALGGFIEGYTLGRQDMIREIEKFIMTLELDWETYSSWQALKKRELPQPRKGED